MKNYLFIIFIFMFSSCSYLSGPDGVFPDTQYDFLDDELSTGVITTDDLDLEMEEDHYPIVSADKNTIFAEVPKPRQIFSAGG